MFVENLAITIAVAVEEASSQIAEGETLELTFLIALLFSAIHLLSDRIHSFLYKSEEIATSFGGGMAVSYVFMHLLPELEKGDRIFGVGIHFIALIGFLIFYGVQRFAWKSALQDRHKSNVLFSIELGFYCLYNGLLIYAMPEQFKSSLPFIVLYLVAMSLHLISADRSLMENYHHQFKSWGRYVLIAALVAALTIDFFTEPANELVSDVLIAILAGSLIFNIFKEELPSPRNSSFRWFGAGAILYLVLLGGSLLLTT